MSLIKIIYFDESFVADFMQIIAGGQIKKTTELISNTNLDADGSLDAQISLKNDKIGIPKLLEFLTGVSGSAEAKIGSNLSINKNKIVKNILENTLLADFLDLLKNDSKRKPENRRCNGIHIFPSLKVKPEPNSFTFFMLAAPYMSMLNGDIPIQTDDGNDFKIDIKQIGDAIDSGRGYYEFISNHNGNDIILRFNITAFRNNYTMSDLPKMELTYYGVYVGKTDKSKLQIQDEFEFGTNQQQRIQYGQHETENSIEELEVYDIILAGVEE